MWYSFYLVLKTLLLFQYLTIWATQVIYNHNPQFVTFKKLHMNLKLYLNFAKRAFKPVREKSCRRVEGKKLLPVFNEN